MGFTIKGAGNGNEAEVSVDNKLQTEAVATSQQHYISMSKGLTYQVRGELTVATSDEPLIFLKNNDPDNDLVVSYIRLETIGVAAASAAAYFTVSLGDTLTTAGDVVTPVNMNVGSANEADTLSYEHGGALVVAAGSVIDKTYLANDMIKYNKEGTIVLPKGTAICIRYKGSTIAGTAIARISFYMDQA